MKSHPSLLWQSRSPRERAILAVTAVIMALTLYGYLVLYGNRVHQRLNISVSALHTQSSLLRQQAQEIERLQTAPPLPESATGLQTLLQAQADTAGISRQLAKIESAGTNRAEVVFSDVAFSQWLQWVSELERNKVRVDSSHIIALPEPGMVVVTATMARASSR